MRLADHPVEGVVEDYEVLVALSALDSVAFFVLIGMSPQAAAQWEHRYPKLSDFRHHVYLEQHELPILAAGPAFGIWSMIALRRDPESIRMASGNR